MSTVRYTTETSWGASASQSATVPEQPATRILQTRSSAGDWLMPTLELLERSSGVSAAQDRSEELIEALAELGAPCEPCDVVSAPQTIRYELAPGRGVRMRAFKGIEDDLMQMLGATSVKVQAPIPGRRTIGVELARDDRATVRLGDVEQSAARMTADVGVGVDGLVLSIDIASLPHLLVAGQSGGGKSVTLHALLCSILLKNSPDDLELIMIDPKMVEAAAYEGLPHLTHLVQDPARAVGVLWGMVEQMEATYRCMRDYGARDLDELNAALAERGQLPIPRRLCVIDETADLMMQSKSRVESAIVRLAQKGRAAGFHVVLATQSPRANVITGLLKANLTGRLALTTSSALDSRIILDSNGAEDLLGHGDLLYNDGASSEMRRAQSAYVSRSEVEAIVTYWRVEARSHAAVMA